jgi:hypothetical protein
VFFAYAFLGVDLEVDFLVLSEFGNKNIFIEHPDRLNLWMMLGNKIYISGIYIGILQVLIGLDPLSLQLLI